MTKEVIVSQSKLKKICWNKKNKNKLKKADRKKLILSLRQQKLAT